jgi:hypothetical protein
MKCTDTDCHKAIHLPELDVALAQDVNDALRGVRGYGNGNGQIILDIVNGFVQAIDCTLRNNRRARKIKQPEASAG